MQWADKKSLQTSDCCGFRRASNPTNTSVRYRFSAAFASLCALGEKPNAGYHPQAAEAAALLMITLLQICRWLYRTLNTDARPWQIGLAAVLGALAGLLPFGLGMLAVFVVIMLVNCHFGTGFFAWGMFRLISWPLQVVVVRPVGAAFLELMPPFARELLIKAATTPIVSWFRFDYDDVAGAIALWLLLAVPLFIFTVAFFRRYQATLRARLAGSRVMRLLSQVWLFKVLRYVFVG